MKTKLKKIGLLLSGIGLLFSVNAFAESNITIRFSHVVSEKTPKGMAADFFAKRANELTGGKVKVEVYPNSSLYTDKEEFEALNLGMVQMLAPSLSQFSAAGFREFEVFDLPYMFDNESELRKVTQGKVGKMLFSKLESRGIKGLAFWDNGFKNFSSNAALKTASDLTGKRIRIQSSKVLVEEVKTLGATPQVLSFSEVTKAMKAGIVDGAENPNSNFYSQKMYEAQKYLTVTEHGYLGYAVITSKKFWDELSPDIRSKLELAMKDATDYANSIAKGKNDEDLAAIKATGKVVVYYPTKEERLSFKRELVKVHEAMEARVGKEIIDSVYKETGFNPKQL